MTRLDRLLTLLDTGSTPATRRAAAVQIGEIQKCHPYDLQNLLQKVYVFLRSKSWDTRIAAGHAIDNIAANAPLWDPEVQPPASTTTETPADPSAATTTSTTPAGPITPASVAAAAGYLSFDTFDIQKVLTSGTPLVASGGQEYDIMVEDMDPKELVAFQKKQLKQRLGLGEGGDFMDMGDMLKDEDFIVTAEQAKLRKKAEEETKKKTQEVSSLVNTAGMSGRERYMAKRRQRNAQKDNLRESQENLNASTEEPNAKRARGLKTVVTEQSHTSDKIVIESVVDQEKVFDSREWPFAPLCEDLCRDLFDPNWETRHGAAIGLREVLRRHGTGAGKTSDARSKEELEAQNIAFLDDCAIRLLCVFALDRFCDFVSDQMVAPVRESCAQALGTVIKFMRPTSVLLVLDNLLKLGERVQWEVRHVGLLGIKYLVGVRVDLVDQILPRVLNSIITGLMDDDDDVRAVAADTLHPIASAVVSNPLGFEQLPIILTTLWDILEDLDDLTASTPSVMNLLAEFYSQPSLTTSVTTSQPLPQLIPRLWPFLRHTNPLVRAAALRMLEKLVRFLTPVLPDAMAHVYQTILVDEREDIRSAAQNVWDSMLKTNESAAIRVASFNQYGNWLYLAGTPGGAPLEQSLMVHAKHLVEHKPKSHSFPPSSSSSSASSSAPAGRGRGRGRGKKAAAPAQAPAPAPAPAAQAGNGQAERKEEVAVGGIRLRCSGSKAIASLLRSWPAECIQEVYVPLIELLASPWASHQHTASLVITDAFYCEISQIPFPPIPDVIKEKLELQVSVDSPPPYGEIDSLVLSSLRTDAQVLSQSLLRLGLTIEDLEYFNEETATMDTASKLATATYDACLAKLAGRLTPEILDGLDARRRRLLVTVGYIQTYHVQLHISNQGAAAGALVSSLYIPEKITPVVRSLMNSVKCEEDAMLQKRGAHALGHLVVQCTSRKVCPNTKILQGLIGALSADRSYTPIVKIDPALNGIKKEKKEKKKENGDEPAAENVEAPPPEDPALVLARKGAILALRRIVSQYGAQLFDSLPKLWDNMIQPTMAYYEQTKDSPFGDVVHVPGSEPLAQQLVDSLQLLRSILPALHTSLLPRMETIHKPLIHTVRHPARAAQEMGGRTLATLCKVHTLQTMQAVITDLLPLLGDTKSVNNRYGAALALHYIIEELGNDVLPYIVLVIIPILGCMSDQDIQVRKTVTGCFATLLKLMPLESGVPDPPGLSAELAAQKASERHFLEQLLDGTKIDKYHLPIKINAELRKYQQDGVNWLAFLNKYKLHGILCDDMGLGKTLQTICIMAGDDFYRRQNYAITPTANFQPLPSLVVCPPTLVGHWCAEIQKFCEPTIKPLSYMGSPNERANLRKQFKDYTILIMSYDILRNDIEHLQTMHFNYCVLDEGHIIKNAKTKITKAVKLVRANHRLILSGTPIQNNVLELWSLFDFLMPGFLGSERMFNEIYSKPILASKDPKCSPKDQEQGTLAIENLHRQVLPFLLRRLKEDVLADLPPKIIQDYHCDLSPLQVRLYESFGKTNVKHNIDDELEEDAEEDEGKKKKSKKKEEGEGGGGGGKGQASHIFQALQYLRKLCCHPLLVLNPKHPEYEAVMRELKQSKKDPHDLSNAPKLLALRDLLHECGIGTGNSGSLTSSSSSVSATNEIESVASQHRVLIFAQMKAMLDIIESDLLKPHMPSVTYLRMDGSVEPSKRQSIVNQFNSDPTIDLLLLTTHVGGLGLNLTGADTVIFVEHDWNPMKDLQAMDRAHRLGQTKVVNVYRLIARGTLEEKIMGLQKFKLNIANTVINKENTSISTMSTDQLLDLFSYEASAKKGKGATTAGEGSTDLMGNVDKKKPGKLKSVLDSLEELWDESQYEEYNLESFLGKLN